MEAYAIVQHGKPLEKLSRPTPVPVGREVLVAVTHSGICHSDLHVIEGRYDLGSRGELDLAKRGLKLPLIPGHEVVGNVVSWGVDADGEGLNAGDVKLVFPWVGCGDCSRCRADEQNLCLSMRPMGLADDGGYSTHVLVSDPKYLLNIDGLDPAVAATYACSGVTVYGAYLRCRYRPRKARRRTGARRIAGCPRGRRHSIDRRKDQRGVRRTSAFDHRHGQRQFNR